MFIRNIHIRENPLSNNVKENGQRSFEFFIYLDHTENVRYLFQVTFYRRTQQRRIKYCSEIIVEN